MNGWIKIDRSIQDHWIWSDAVKLKCWVALLLNASHSHQKVLMGNQIVECHRGDIVGTLRSIADQLGVSKDYLRQLLVIFQKDFMINYESTPKYTRITICNYESYQGSLHAVETNSRQTQDKDKNVKNEKKNVIDKKSKELDYQRYVDKFTIFWTKYKRPEGKAVAMKSWMKLTEEEMDKVLETVDAYVAWKSDVKYRKHASTYLNQKNFNDEIPAMFVAPIKQTTTTYQPPSNAIF